jgi:rhodanese-related sulfurtransferase
VNVFAKMSLRLQTLVLVLLGVGLGLAGNQISPRGLPLMPLPLKASATGDFITLTQAKQLWYAGAAFFLDARDPADFAAGHIGNALNLPAQSFAQHFGEVAPMFAPNSELVVYCDGKECELSRRLRESLLQLGYTNTHQLANGWTAWRQAGLPVTQAGQP